MLKKTRFLPLRPDGEFLFTVFLLELNKTI